VSGSDSFGKSSDILDSTAIVVALESLILRLRVTNGDVVAVIAAVAVATETDVDVDAVSVVDDRRLSRFFRLSLKAAIITMIQYDVIL
jgi:hypothetical protein